MASCKILTFTFIRANSSINGCLDKTAIFVLAKPGAAVSKQRLPDAETCQKLKNSSLYMTKIS
jgi:hypothetical protein